MEICFQVLALGICTCIGRVGSLWVAIANAKSAVDIQNGGYLACETFWRGIEVGRAEVLS
jgi:hypothetical protein